MRQIIITNSRGCLGVSKKNVETEKLFLTLNEACKMLRLSRPTLVKLIKRGKIKAFKPKFYFLYESHMVTALVYQVVKQTEI